MSRAAATPTKPATTGSATLPGSPLLRVKTFPRTTILAMPARRGPAALGELTPIIVAGHLTADFRREDGWVSWQERREAQSKRFTAMSSQFDDFDLDVRFHADPFAGGMLSR